MKRIHKIAIAAGVVVVAAAGFMFFSKNTNSEAVVEIETSSPFSFNTTKGQSNPDFAMSNLITASPMTMDIDGKAVNYAAKKVDVLNAGKTIKITLKDGLKYQDGTSVVAQDYKTAIDVLDNPKTKANYSSWVTDYIVGGKDFFEGKSKTVSGVKVLSKNSYEINLNRSYNFFKSMLTSAVWGPIKQSVIDRIGIENYGVNYKDVLSSGEYKISKYAKSQYLEYTKNEGTSLITKDIPKTFKTRIILQPDVMAGEFKKGKVNSIGKTEITDKILGYDKSKKADFTYMSPSMSYLANGGLSPQNMNALYLALDKDYMVTNFYKGYAITRNTLTPQPYAIEKQVKEPTKNNFSIELAKQTKASDLKEVTLQVEAESSATSLEQAKIKYIVGQWEKIGVKTNIVKKPFGPAAGNFGPNTKPRAYDVTMASFGPDYPHPHTFYGSLLGSTTYSAYSYWNNADIKKYDELVQKAADQIDDTKTNEYYLQADKIQRDNAQLLPLYEGKVQRYVKKNGWRTVSMGQVLRPTMWVQFK